MKRRNLILSFVVIALLLIGIGYAASSGELAINGTANVEASDFIVEFADGEGNKAGQTATVEVDLSSGAPQATATVTVKNFSSALTAELGELSVEYEGEAGTYISVTPSYGKTTLLKGEDTVITLVVDLIKVPADAAVFTFTVTFAATSVAAQA